MPRDWKNWTAGKTPHVAAFPRRRYQEPRKLKLFAVALGGAVPTRRESIAATRSPHGASLIGIRAAVGIPPALFVAIASRCVQSPFLASPSIPSTCCPSRPSSRRCFRSWRRRARARPPRSRACRSSTRSTARSRRPSRSAPGPTARVS